MAFDKALQQEEVESESETEEAEREGERESGEEAEDEVRHCHQSLPDKMTLEQFWKIYMFVVKF